MNSRNSIIYTGLTCLFAAQSVMGLGIGEIKQQSALNEPLVAEVELLGLGDLSELEILVNLGSRQDFENAGVDREFFLTDLKFAIDLSDRKHPLIRITSHKPVKEPYLDFLMEVQWPSGRLLREYTLLLDLPVFSEGTPEVKQVEAASSTRQPPSQRNTSTSSSRPASSTTSTSAATAGTSYRVQSGDTLWQVAENIRPGGSSVHQAMAAIYQQNPDAFIDGNANLLKSGSVLRLPQEQDIASIQHRDAVNQLNTDSVASSVKEQPSVVTDHIEEESTDVMLDASPLSSESSSIDESTYDEGHLKLTVAAEEQTTSSSDALSSTSPALTDDASAARTGDLVSANLDTVREELDKTNRENIELRDRLSNLEEQIEAMQRLMELNDPTLAALQEKAASESEEQSADNAGAVDDTTGEQPAALDPATTPATIPAKSPAKQPIPSGGNTGTEAKSLQDWLNLLLYPLIGLLAVLLAIFLLFRNRNDDDETSLREDEPQFLSPLKMDKGRETEEENPDLLTPDEAALAASIGETVDQEDLSGLDSDTDDAVDPITEADIYLSLGNYDHAENLLLDVLQEDGNNAGLHLKLLEVYAASGAMDKFESRRQILDTIGDEEASRKAEALFADTDLGSVEDLDETSLTTESTTQNVQNVDSESTDSSPLPVASDHDGLSEFDLELELGEVEANAEGADIAPEASELSSVGEAELGDALDLDLSVFETSDEKLGELDDDQLEDLLDSDVSSEEVDSVDLMADIDADLDMLPETDECATKLDLAEAFMEMGDRDGAKEILEEVLSEGNDEQKDKAKSLIDSLS